MASRAAADAGSRSLVYFRLAAAAFIALWTFLIVSAVALQYFSYEKTARNHARAEARTAFENDLLYRKWSSSHGGVYVPETESMAPNPYLDVPHRDVATTAGKKLTLVNPAYMTRLVAALRREETGVQVHITSLRPINPANAPDGWESASLRLFEGGAKEAAIVSGSGAGARYRFMRPFVVEQSCLACHAQQGYAVGHVRGGISVTMPFGPFRSEARAGAGQVSLLFFAVWAAGSAIMLAAFLRMRKDLKTRIETENLLREMNRRLSGSDDAPPGGRVFAEEPAADGSTLAERLAEAQKRLIDSEKASALGLLVSGLAHGLNSPLGSISSSSFAIENLAGSLLEDWKAGSFDAEPEEREALASFLERCRESERENGSIARDGGGKRRLRAFLAERSLSLSEDTLAEFADLRLDFDLEPYLPLFASPNADGLLRAAATMVSLFRSNALTAVAVEKASRDIAALQQFGGDGARSEAVALDAKDLMVKATALIPEDSLRSVRLERSYADGVPVRCDPDAVARVLFDLMKNALYAMRYSGSLHLSVGEREGRAAFDVGNDGPPLPPEIRERLFTPFFTTKKRGEGKGLGLFLSKRIVERAGGTIAYSSEKGRTTFTVLLPLYYEAKEHRLD